MAGKVFFNCRCRWTAFIAPESLQDLMGQQWMELQQCIFPQRYIVLDRRPGLAARAVHQDP